MRRVSRTEFPRQLEGCSSQKDKNMKLNYKYIDKEEASDKEPETKHKYACCICGQDHGGDKYSHSPYPLVHKNDYDSRCCASCNDKYVVPIRLFLHSLQGTFKPKVYRQYIDSVVEDLKHNTYRAVDSTPYLERFCKAHKIEPEPSIEEIRAAIEEKDEEEVSAWH